MSDALVPSNAEELERLMTQYGDSLLRMCWMMLHDYELARDATQDSFLKAYKAMDTLGSQETEKAWLMRIAINTCKDLYRSRWWRMVDRRIDLDQLPERGEADKYVDPTLFLEVMNLPEKYRQVIILHFYQNLSLVEIGQVLGVPSSTIRSRLLRAKSKLHNKLEGWYLNESSI